MAGENGGAWGLRNVVTYLVAWRLYDRMLGWVGLSQGVECENQGSRRLGRQCGVTWRDHATRARWEMNTRIAQNMVSPKGLA